MTEASKRTAQQQRIQQLQERLELYNAAASRTEATSSSSATIAAGTASATTSINGNNNGSGGGGRPTRAPPQISSSSPNAPSQAAPISRTAGSASKFSPTSGIDQSNLTAPTKASTKAAAATTTTTATAAARRTETARVSPHPQKHHQTPLAPRLARNLAEDFLDSARTSPSGATAETNHTSSSPLNTYAAATATTATAASLTSAPAAATTSTKSPLGASDVFGYYNESDEETEKDGCEGHNEHVEYEVEEMEEYEEDESDDEDDYTEEEEESDGDDASQPQTLENVLRRIFRSYSGSSERNSNGLSSDKQSAASPNAHDPSHGSSSTTRVASTAAGTIASAAATSSSTNSLIQRAAELYRQHRLHQAQQLHNHSPFQTSDGIAARGFLGLHRDPAAHSDSSMSTSAPTVELDDVDMENDTVNTSRSSDSYMSPATTYAAFNSENAASLDSHATAAASVAPTNMMSSPPHTAVIPNSTAPPSASPISFAEQEKAYRQLLLLQRGVEYAVERIGIQHFPQPLPHQDRAQTLAQQRNLLVQKDMEMRAAPPGGASLEDVRRNEAAALEAAVAAIDAKFAAALQSAKSVIDRGVLVEEKRRLLKQRERDLAEQREARIIVEREVTKLEDLLRDRRDRLKKREADYAAQLQQHDEQQNAAQRQIVEVEQLSKQVSSWLAILEERDSRLARKEKRLQGVQADLDRRNEDVAMWKKAALKVKQIPPPPSPPRIS